MGVKVDGLREAQGAAQQLLLGEPDHGRRDAEVAIDQLRAKFGNQAVKSARLVTSEEE